MHLASLSLKNFRSCVDTNVCFHDELTILAGENNAGKTNVLEGIRLITTPSNLRRDRYAEEDDVRRGVSPKEFTILAHYSGLSDTQKGLMIAAVPDPAKSDAFFGLRYAAPSGKEGERRGKVAFWAGKEEGSDPEPEAREIIRHVHLPALRDAQRVLSSGSGSRIAFLLKQITGDRDSLEEFVNTARTAMGVVEEHRVITDANKLIETGLRNLTVGVRPQTSTLQFAEADLNQLARDLRFRLGNAGVDPADLAQSGLGYANLLYMATVMVELQAAKEADLTLLLVEEPEAHLHPQLQSMTLQYLQDQVAKTKDQKTDPGKPAGRIQVIVSTHSPHLTAAVSARHVAVLRVAAIQGPQGKIATIQRSGDADGQGAAETRDGDRGEATMEQKVVQEQTVAVSIDRLGLLPSVLAKLDRYLNVTRSSLLFSQRAVLVEGMAEAILLPELARHIVLVGDGNKEKLSKFLCSTLIPIDGVDFQPYVEVLLRAHAGNRIADQVVIITDADPQVPGDRRDLLLKVATECGATPRLGVYVADPTLEAELFLPQNQAALKAAFLDIHPRSESLWQKLLDSPEPSWPSEFVRILRETRTRKGDFAQRLAGQIADGVSFTVPLYLREAIDAVVNDGHPKS